MSFNPGDFYPDGAGSSSSSSSTEPTTPYLRKDELQEALSGVEPPGPLATQKTLRERLAALVDAFKGLATAVVLLASFCGADTIPWEEVPPDMPVDTNAVAGKYPASLTNGFLRVETDPTVPAWAKASSPPEIPPESDPVFAAASNRFLTAHQSLAPATNYTDAAITAFAAANPPPDLSGYATAPGVTNIVKSLSLGGIWDEQLQVWWTPRMRNGSLTYEATTNINLNAGN